MKYNLKIKETVRINHQTDNGAMVCYLYTE